MIKMQRIMCKSKIHGAKITETNVDYEGSITIDKNLMEAADLIDGEKVLVSTSNGERLETYAITGKKDSGIICLNGPAALKAKVGDKAYIFSFVNVDYDIARDIKVKIVKVGINNKII